MIRDTIVRLKGGRPNDTGRVAITSCVRREKLCMVIWSSRIGDVNFTWERECDLVKVV